MCTPTDRFLAYVKRALRLAVLMESIRPLRPAPTAGTRKPGRCVTPLGALSGMALCRQTRYKQVGVAARETSHKGLDGQ